MERAGELVRLVGAKGGVVTSADLRSAGFSQNEVSAAVSTGLLHKVRRGLFVLAGKTLTWEQKLLCATRATEPQGAVAAVSAATLLRFDDFTERPVQVIVPAKHQFELEGVQVLRARNFDPAADTKRVCGVPVTKVPRTLLDLLPFCTETQLIVAIEGLIRNFRGIVRGAVPYLRERARGRRDVLHLVEVIRERLQRRPTDDKWEVRAELLMNEACLHPSRQVDLFRPDGTFVGRADTLFWSQRLLVEVDGEKTHGTLRGQEADRVREASLRMEGYDVFRTSPRELRTDPRGFISRLRCHLATRPMRPVPPMSPQPEQLTLL